MKVGIFGDSYCDKNTEWQGVRDTTKDTPAPSWFKHLEFKGLDIECYGLGGTSILYSANLIEKFAKNYDFIIWCVTDSSRISVNINESPHVLNSCMLRGKQNNYSTLVLNESKIKLNLLKQWDKYILDLEEQKLVGKSLVQHCLITYKNLMVIPNFKDPLDDINFCLHDVSKLEEDFYFSSISGFCTYTDRRCSHMSIKNNEILGNLVFENLKPGIFQTSISNFSVPTEDFNFYYEKN